MSRCQFAAVCCAAIAILPGFAVAGTWTMLTNQGPAPAGPGTMLLLTDGTVMVQEAWASKRWDRLHPDANGDYLNGTWTRMADMNLERLYYGSNVLPNGTVFVVGGEYSGPLGDQNWTNTGEIYDPASNAWTSITNFPQDFFGDDPTILLPTGQVLCGYLSSPQTYLFDPNFNIWIPTGNKLRDDVSDEETWIMLRDGSVLSYDIFSSPETGAGHAQRYVPNSGTWVDAGSPPVPLTSAALGYELGPATLLPDGRVFQVGATENTAIYNPLNNSWIAGPTLPAGYGADDAPGVMLPNGQFIFLADNPLFNAPTKVFQFDYQTKTLTDITPGGGPDFAANAAFYSRFLMLPNGHVLFTDSVNIWDYDPTGDGAPLNAWRPIVFAISKSPTASSYIITGERLTGMWQGASYGDDAEMDTNYPLVRITDNAGKVHFAKTTHWTPGVATGLSTVQFTLPPAFPTGGFFTLEVVANGIASPPTPFNPNISCPIAGLLNLNRSWSPGQPIKLSGIQSPQRLLGDLRRFRDDVLKQHPAGRELVQMYYDESLAVTRTLAWRPFLAAEAVQLLAEVQRAVVIDGRAQSSVVLSQDTYQRGLAWLDRLEALVPATTRDRFQSARRRLQSATTSVDDVVLIDFASLKPGHQPSSVAGTLRVPKLSERGANGSPAATLETVRFDQWSPLKGSDSLFTPPRPVAILRRTSAPIDH